MNYRVDSHAVDKWLKQDQALQMLEKCVLEDGPAVCKSASAMPKQEPALHCSQETRHSGSKTESRRRKASIVADPIYQNNAKIQRKCDEELRQ